MKIFLLLLLPLISLGQTDSTVLHFPNTLPCTAVAYYINDTQVGTQALTPNVTVLDYVTNFGWTAVASDTYPFYSMHIIDYHAVITPFIRYSIRPTGCLSIVEVYTKVFQQKAYNE